MTPPPLGSAPTGVFHLAFDDPTLTWDPAWARIDNWPNLVASYTIDRGRQYELDHTDVGRAVVEINDVDGVLDPTNTASPYYGKIEPLIQACICRINPVSGVWHMRFRGFVEDFNYDFDPSQQVNRLTISLVDIQEILAAIELMPGSFGIDTTGTDAEGNIGYPQQLMWQRIRAVLGDADIPEEFAVVFTGNVGLHSNPTYSPGESVMTVIQDAAEAEFAGGVANTYGDRFGRLAVHGRFAKFSPEDVTHLPGEWDFTEWKVGDGVAVALDPDNVAHLRAFAYNRGLSKIINSAFATPVGIDDADISGPETLMSGTLYRRGQHLYDTASIGQYGWRSWSAQNLLTRRGEIDDTTDLEETRRFSEYYVQNYKDPKNRVTECTLRSMRDDDPRAQATWAVLDRIDISHRVLVTVGAPGGGGFTAEPFYVEGVHEQVRPLGADYDDVTMSLDLSPQGYFAHNPWGDT